MKIKNIIEATNGKLINGNLEKEIHRICRDTRKIQEGDTYIGIKGENFDGNTLWEEALKRGAETIIIQGINFEKENITNYRSKNIIQVENTLQALGEIAKYKRNLYGEDFKLVGVTGSVGKTSTKDIIANVISQKYKTLKTQGNSNNEIGLPFTIFNLDNHEAAVIEMGMNHFGEISRLTKIAKPKIAVITNVGTSHIGNLGSRENILKAKLEILEEMKEKILVINNDNDLLHNYYLNNKTKDIEIHTYGIENNSDVYATDIKLNENSSEFLCHLKNTEFKIKVPVGGIHFVYNALCAVVIGDLLKLNIQEITKGIETFELTEKRMDITELKNNVKIINDSYNASFESMKAAMEYLGNLKNNRKIAVLGDMFELGEFSEKLHYEVGKEVVANEIDVLICSGENAKNIIKAAKDEGMNKDKIYYFENKNEIIDFLKKFWSENDVILFKASNGMRFFEIVKNIIENENSK